MECLARIIIFMFISSPNLSKLESFIPENLALALENSPTSGSAAPEDDSLEH